MPKLFESAFVHAAIGMALVGLDGRFLRVNRSLCQLVGYAESELLALSFQELTHPDDLDLDLAWVAKMIAGEIESYQMEKRYWHKSGRIVWVLLSVSMTREPDGQPECFISQIQDITARKETEQELNTFFDLPMLFRAVIATDGSFRRLSPQWMKALQFSREELMAMDPRELIHPKDRARSKKALADLFRGRPTECFCNRMRRQDGAYLWLMSCAVAMPGRDVAIMVATDVTAIKEAEARALADAEEKARLYDELRETTEKVRTLQKGLVTICAWTKQVRQGQSWETLESFLSQRLGLKISHGMSDEIAGQMMKELRDHDGR